MRSTESMKKMMSQKSCANCIHSGTYTVNEYLVCWLLTGDLPDDYVAYLEDIDGPCEEYEDGRYLARFVGKKGERNEAD